MQANAIKPVLLDRLKQALPTAAEILHQPAQVAPFECDGLTAYRKRPMIVVLPRTCEEVRTVVQTCRELKVPLVTRGAGTGLSGGALPLERGVLLVTSKMNHIVDIDLDNHQITVEPGVTNLAISKAVEQYGLYYAPDPSSQVACSIGGNVAENSGGVHCLKYGLTLHNVRRLEVITIDNEQLEIGAYAPDAPGYDLLALLTGSEGMLAVITKITVRLLAKPPHAQVILIAFKSLESAADAVAAITASSIIPAGLEMMDQPAVRAVEAFMPSGYPTEAQAVLLCELDGTADDVHSQTEQLLNLVKAHHPIHVEVAADPQTCARLWAGRKAAFPAVGRLAPDYYCMDGTIPRRRLAEVLTKINALSKKYNLGVANVFHAGDGNLHPLIMYDANNPGDLEKAEAFGKDILELSIQVGGTITGEHGVGVEKLDSMCSQFNAAEVQQFQLIKRAFDPDELLNPGKAIPTLRRCAELGAMHVHKGKLPHPDLPRF